MQYVICKETWCNRTGVLDLWERGRVMPLVAMDAQTGKRIDITVYKNPRWELSASQVCCPECKLPMILKAGLILIAHFAHKPGAA